MFKSAIFVAILAIFGGALTGCTGGTTDTAEKAE
jgi:hypothetical protein